MKRKLYQNDNPGGKTTLTLELLADGALQLFYYDIGPASRATFGDSDYEAWLNIRPDDIPKLAIALLADRYSGRHDAMSDLKKFCAANSIEFDDGVWT